MSRLPDPSNAPYRPALMRLANLVYLLGDVHGNYPWFAQACKNAQLRKCHTILQLGDFGYWEHVDDDTFIDDAARALDRTDRRCIWIDGNHENHPLLRQTYGPGGPRHEPTDDGLWTIRPGLLYAPRGHRWTMGSRTFLALGGAASVDKYRRVLGSSWWPEETITGLDVDAALDGGRVDVMVCHDAPEGTDRIPPEGDWRSDEPFSRANRHAIRVVVDAVRPRLLVHGHYHVRNTADVGDTRVEGFACDHRPRSSAVLDLRDLSIRG